MQGAVQQNRPKSKIALSPAHADGTRQSFFSKQTSLPLGLEIAKEAILVRKQYSIEISRESWAELKHLSEAGCRPKFYNNGYTDDSKLFRSLVKKAAELGEYKTLFGLYDAGRLKLTLSQAFWIRTIRREVYAALLAENGGIEPAPDVYHKNFLDLLLPYHKRLSNPQSYRKTPEERLQLLAEKIKKKKEKTRVAKEGEKGKLTEHEAKKAARKTEKKSNDDAEEKKRQAVKNAMKPAWAKFRSLNAEKRDRFADFFERHRGPRSALSKTGPENGLFVGYWSDEAVRRQWTRALARFLKKNPHDLKKKDFIDNGLGGLLRRYGSIYAAVSDAFPELGLNEWEMKTTLKNFFDDETNRVRATHWLAKKVKKDPRSLLCNDFKNNGLSGLIERYGNSTWKAVAEAYPFWVKSKEDMFLHSNRVYTTREMRRALLRTVLYKNPKDYTPIERAVAEKHRLHMEEMILDDWIIWKQISNQIIDPRDLTGEYLAAKGLTGLFRYYNESTYKMLRDLLPSEHIRPWELLKTPMGIFENPETRREATRWLCEVKLKRDPREVTGQDFLNNRLSGLLKHYSFTHFLALKDAYPGMDLKPWKMKRIPRNTFSTPENRADAVLWLAEELKKPVERLTRHDMLFGGLAQILRIKVFIREAIAEGLTRKEQLGAEKARDF